LSFISHVRAALNHAFLAVSLLQRYYILTFLLATACRTHENEILIEVKC